jgi:dihydropteroate synthase
MTPNHATQTAGPAPANAPAMMLRAGRFTYRFPRPVLVMGIVNVTPDSFSDGGRFFATETAVTHALRLVEEGADLLDIGGESTRPGAEPVPEAEEQRRVLPVIERLAARVSVPLSIDTMKPGVARAALAAGACLVNDVAANRSDLELMARLLVETGAGYVVMHMQGTPRTMQTDPVYGDVMREVHGFFEERLHKLQALGVAPEQVILDVGIGFGKDLDHNLLLLKGLDRFRQLERPLMVGASRKSFIGKLLGVDLHHRLPGSIAAACWASWHGAQILRVHDVAETVQAVRMCEAIARAQSQPQVAPHLSPL